MTPAYTGVVAGYFNGRPAEISVTGATFDPSTTVWVKETTDEVNAVTARITLTEEGKREVIELLGGTP